MVVRQYEEELKFIERLTDHSWRIKKDFQPNMNVEGKFATNKKQSKIFHYIHVFQEFSTSTNTSKS
jgi:tRNA-splicing ligase RtcB